MKSKLPESAYDLQAEMIRRTKKRGPHMFVLLLCRSAHSPKLQHSMIMEALKPGGKYNQAISREWLLAWKDVSATVLNALQRRLKLTSVEADVRHYEAIEQFALLQISFTRMADSVKKKNPKKSLAMLISEIADLQNVLIDDETVGNQLKAAKARRIKADILDRPQHRQNDVAEDFAPSSRPVYEDEDILSTPSATGKRLGSLRISFHFLANHLFELSNIPKGEKYTQETVEQLLSKTRLRLIPHQVLAQLLDAERHVRTVLQVKPKRRRKRRSIGKAAV